MYSIQLRSVPEMKCVTKRHQHILYRKAYDVVDFLGVNPVYFLPILHHYFTTSVTQSVADSDGINKPLCETRDEVCGQI